MKTFLNLKQCLILFAAVFSLTSCLKSDDPDFQIVAGGYVNQKVTEISGGEGEDVKIESEFTPVVLVQGNEQIANCTASGSKSMLLGKTNDYGTAWKTISATPFEELPISTYTITGVNAEGKSASTYASFSPTQGMKNKLKGDIDYNNGVLIFTFSKVENATAYLVIAKSSSNATYFESFEIKGYTETEAKIGEELKLEESSIASKITVPGTYRITLAAVISSSNGMVYQENDKYVSYTKE